MAYRLAYLNSIAEGYRWHVEPHMLDLSGRLAQFYHGRGKDLEWGASYSKQHWKEDNRG